jgi:hypothetical protein
MILDVWVPRTERQARPRGTHQRHRPDDFKTKIIGSLCRLQKMPHIVRAFSADPDLRYHHSMIRVREPTNS